MHDDIEAHGSRAAALPSLGVSAMAACHAAGHGVRALWDAVADSQTALRANALEWCELPCWIGAVPGVDEVKLPAEFDDWDCRLNRLVFMALDDAPFRKAVAAAVNRHGAHRIGVVIGTSTSGIRSTEIGYQQRRETGQWPAQLNYRNMHSSDAAARFAARLLGIRGPLAVVTTACSSSAKVFLTAQRWVATGVVDAVLVGGADSLCLSTLHGFHSLQLLSAEICRPFDQARKGIAIGEAAGFVLLEPMPRPLQFVGGGESSDAWHMSTPQPDGLGAQQAMHAALSGIGIGTRDIGYVNAHGTGTAANDRAEAAALNAVFGEAGVPVSSTKGVTGHTLGAAGIVEAIIALLALEQQALPASANLQTPDPGLQLDLITQRRSLDSNFAMSNNFGFGGSNCSLVFGRAA